MCTTKLSIAQRNWILYGFCSLPLLLGTCSIVFGVWLCVVVLHNARLPLEGQIYFEKLITWSRVHGAPESGGTYDDVLHLDNESPFSHTPVDNLCFYLLALSFVTVLGGCGRVLATSFFCLHLSRNRITGQLFWAWLALLILAVTIEVLVTYDVMHTLSHNDVAPPYQRDFYFTNDHQGFYWLCITLRCFIWVDLIVSGVAQLAVCYVYRIHLRQNQI